MSKQILLRKQNHLANIVFPFYLLSPAAVLLSYVITFHVFSDSSPFMMCIVVSLGHLVFDFLFTKSWRSVIFLSSEQKEKFELYIWKVVLKLQIRGVDVL